MVLLVKRGFVRNRDPKTFFREVVFSGAHDASMRALLNGHVDAIASFDLAREQYLSDPAERERVAWVAETEAIPEAGIAARDGLDLVVRAGEFVVVLGRSGAGKTTFLRSINRLVEPTAGAVRVAGRAVTGAAAGELRLARRRIGVIFQQFNLVRRASVLDNVLAGRLGYVPSLPSLIGRFPPGDRRLARECLAQVGLERLAERRADTLSGGEQQRVAIARALAQSPAVILADEPTASLDPQLTVSIMDILKAINVERGLTLVVSQHQLETALAYATRLVGFRRGRIVFDGPPHDLTPTVIDAIYGDGDAG